ncbi:MAG: hypothetical protein QOF21_2615, partial [Actinomycetota bacterium]
MVTATGGNSQLLERETEQKAVDGLLVDASSGLGRLLMIEGPAGIGKTGLLNAAYAAARERELQVGRALGDSLEQDFAFGAVRKLLEPLVRNAADPDRLFVGAASAAAPILGGADLSEGAAPGVVLHGLYWLTAALAEKAPLVLICDDAHWFDAPSVRFLTYLANRVQELPIAVLIGTRPPEPGPAGELLTRLLADHATVRLRPEPLSARAVTTIVRSSLDEFADDAFCSAVAESSRGNPFLIGELVRAARAAGFSPEAENAASLTELSAGSAVLGRLRRLTPGAAEFARSVAVLGPDAHLRHAAALAGLDADEAGLVADALLRAEILGPERPLSFVHPLVRSAVYNDLLPGERAARHRKAVDLLIAEGAPAERLATHLMATEPAGIAATVDVLTAAARTALGRGATDVAVTYLRRALAEPPAAERRLDVVLELGTAEAFGTDPGAIERLGEAIAMINDPATRIMLAMARGIAFCLHGRPKDAIAMFDDLRAEMHDEKLSLELLAGAVLVGMTGPTAAPLVADRIAELMERVGPDSDVSASVLGVRSFVGAFANEPAEVCGAIAARALAS